MSRDVKSLVDELAEASVEAKRVLSELRSELKEARRVRAEFETAVKAAAPEAVDGLIAEAIKPQLKSLSAQIDHTQHALSDKVQRRFDELANMCQYGNKAGTGANIFNEMRAKCQELDYMLSRLVLAVEARLPGKTDG